MIQITRSEKIINYLKKNNGQYCDSCLSKECGISSPNSVNQECNYLKQSKKIERKISKCNKCGKHVYVNSLVEINFDNNIKPSSEEKEGESTSNKVGIYGANNNTHEKTITEFLKQKNLEYCDDCIAKLCNIQPRQTVNQTCRKAYAAGKIIRGYSQCSYCGKNKITNSFNPKTEQFISPKVHPQRSSSNNNNVNMSEDLVKQLLAEYLEKNVWKAKVAMGKEHGADIEAYRDNAKWIIEVKGCGSLNAMRVNYFISILGETLQRMDDENSKYSIALPKIQQFINLWDRLPKLAKDRTGISALFVDESGNVEEII